MIVVSLVKVFFFLHRGSILGVNCTGERGRGTEEVTNKRNECVECEQNEYVSVYTPNRK